MADKAVISNSILNDTAAAIQEKDGDLTPMLPQEMPARIRAIPQGSVPPSLKSLTRIEDYLYEASCGDLKEEEAESYFKARFWDGTIPANGSALGACTAFRNGNFFGRNYDWKYDEAVSFAVRSLAESGKRNASIAICNSPSGITRQAVEGHTIPEELWDVMPFFALDGINDHGVVCNVNVVPAHENEGWNGTEFCAISGVRKVLDYAKTALEGATMLAEKAWMPKAELFGGNSLHFMVADKEHTYIVEDGQVYDVTNDESRKIMTNFRIGGYDFLEDYFDRKRVSLNTVAAYDAYGTGAERYNSVSSMLGLYKQEGKEITEARVRSIVEVLKFSMAYDADSEGETSFPTDFAGISTTASGRKLKINETAEIQDWFKREDVNAKWNNRTRDGEFWQTVHSSVYNIEKRTLSVAVQEQNFNHAHEFLLDGESIILDESFPETAPTEENGHGATLKAIWSWVKGLLTGVVNKTDAEYIAIKTYSALGAQHASAEGNPHGTSASDVGAVSEKDARGMVKASDEYVVNKPDWYDGVTNMGYGYTAYGVRGPVSALVTQGKIYSISTIFGVKASQPTKARAKLVGYKGATETTLGVSSVSAIPSVGGSVEFVFPEPIEVNGGLYTQVGLEFLSETSDTAIGIFVCGKENGNVTNYECKVTIRGVVQWNVASCPIATKSYILNEAKMSPKSHTHIKSDIIDLSIVAPSAAASDEGKAADAYRTGLAIENAKVILLKYEDDVIKRGSETITSFAAFLALVQTGRVVLMATATQSSGSSPTLFRPQLTNSNTVLFDATGEIQGVMRTRNIKVSRTGSGGIEVDTGNLKTLALTSDISASNENFIAAVTACFDNGETEAF